MYTRQYNLLLSPVVIAGYQSYTTDSSNVETDSQCNFKSTSADPTSTEDCSMSYDPCSYKVEVQEVFKGNYMVRLNTAHYFTNRYLLQILIFL